MPTEPTSTEPTSTPTNGELPDSHTSDDAAHDFAICPAPFDCHDLAETFRVDTVAAFRMLVTLTPTQLNLQALAYAAYLNHLHGLNLDMDDILTGWLERARRTA